MGFDFHPNKEHQDKEAQTWANQLYLSLRQARKVTKKPNITQWASKLAKLVLEHPRAEIAQVLSYFSKNVQLSTMPKVYSADTFIAQYGRIKLVVDNLNDDIVDETSKKMANRICPEFIFPIEIKSALPIIIQKSRISWILFHAKIEKYIKDNADIRKRENKTEKIYEVERNCNFLKRVLISGACIVENHCVMLSQQFRNMEHYHGSTANLKLDTKSLSFRDSWWRSWSNDWSGNPNSFDTLLQELNG